MAVVVWLRSPYYGYISFFCDIYTGGGYSYYYASWSWAVAPGFAV